MVQTKIDAVEISKVRLGIKIWSINHTAFPKLLEMYKDGTIDYVELYTVPGSFDAGKLEPLRGIPIIFHAPNPNHNFDLSKNDRIFDDAIATIRQFSDYFNERRIIFHPGNLASDERRDIAKNISNLSMLRKSFDIILENVPRLGIDRKIIMLLSDFEGFKEAVIAAKVRSCLDFGHAVASANYHRKSPLAELRKFNSLKPYMYHICDGVYNSGTDHHINLGEGDFPLKEFAALIRPGSFVTLETPKKDFMSLSEDVKNLKYLKELLRQAGGQVH